MAPRIRTRRVSSTYIRSNQPSIVTDATWEFMLDSVPGSSSVDHIAARPSNSTLTYKDGTSASWLNNPPGLFVTSSGGGPAFVAVDLAIAKFMTGLNWAKLPSSNSFNLLLAIKELQETIQVFKLEFWQKLTYGSVTWGLKPLIGDMVALAQQVESLMNRTDSFSYEDALVVPINIVGYTWGAPGEYADITGTVTIRKTGRASLYQGDFSLSVLDRLGFHPDLGTLYDAIPFSFVLDYFIPIGNYLEAFVGRGWVDSVTFTGWFTAKYELVSRWYTKDTGLFTAQTVGVHNIKRFTRSYSADTLKVPFAPELVKFEVPSFLQLFNVLYLLLLKNGEGAQRKRKKRRR